MKEFALLAKVFAHNAHLDPQRITLPPGDDMGMVRLLGRDLLAAVDQVVEGRHFPPDTDPRDIGWKALARSASDIAAMAARPTGSLVAVVLPESWTQPQAEALVAGMWEAAEAFDCPIFGGDVSIADTPLVCSVTVLAEPGPGGVITRAGAQPGDAVWVSGVLGGAWRSSGRDLRCQPRISLALALAEHIPLSAMIDLSDGLGRDLDHIAEASGVCAEIDAARVPIAPGSDLRGALGDGEDYELCFTTSADADVPAELDGIPLTRIGRITPPGALEFRTALRLDGRLHDASQMGWEHGR